MCSIAGIWTPKPVRGGELARQMILCGAALRGDWSAGVWVSGAGRPFHMRSLDVERVADHAAMARGRLFLMHTRLPTSGGYGKRSSQPLVSGNAVTTHNGHVGMAEARTWAALGEVELPADVDSAVFTALCARYGVRKALKGAAEIGGVSGLAMWDGKRLGVMGQAFVWARYSGGVVWASEHGMLPAKLARKARGLSGAGAKRFRGAAPGKVSIGEVGWADENLYYLPTHRYEPSGEQWEAAVDAGAVESRLEWDDDTGAWWRWRRRAGGVWERGERTSGASRPEGYYCPRCDEEWHEGSCEEEATARVARLIADSRRWRPGAR